MTSKNKTLSTKVSPEFFENVNKEVDKYGFKDRSEYIRYCIEYTQTGYQNRDHVERLIKESNKKHHDQIETLIKLLKMTHDEGVETKKSVAEIAEVLGTLSDSI